jgi:hypothetical protein
MPGKIQVTAACTHSSPFRRNSAAAAAVGLQKRGGDLFCGLKPPGAPHEWGGISKEEPRKGGGGFRDKSGEKGIKHEGAKARRGYRPLDYHLLGSIMSAHVSI